MAEVADPSITSGACISFYNLVIVDAQVRALSLTPSFPYNDGGTHCRITLRSMQLVGPLKRIRKKS